MRKITLIALILTTLTLATLTSAQLNNSWQTYPTPNITSINSLFVYDNTVTQNWFTTLLVVAIWIVLVILTATKIDIIHSVAVSSIAATVLSILLGNNSLLNDSVIMIFVCLSVVTILLSFKSGGGY
jgi:hypothetical protein